MFILFIVILILLLIYSNAYLLFDSSFIYFRVGGKGGALQIHIQRHCPIKSYKRNRRIETAETFAKTMLYQQITIVASGYPLLRTQSAITSYAHTKKTKQTAN